MDVMEEKLSTKYNITDTYCKVPKVEALIMCRAYFRKKVVVVTTLYNLNL